LLEQVLACGQVTAGSLYRSYFVSVQMIVSNVTFRGRRLPWGESADWLGCEERCWWYSVAGSVRLFCCGTDVSGICRETSYSV